VVRLIREKKKIWYALPLIGGKKRRIGNLSGTYGINMNHGQVPGFQVFKLFSREDIKTGVRVEETLADYCIHPEMYLLQNMLEGNGYKDTSELTTRIVDTLSNLYVPIIRRETFLGYEEGDVVKRNRVLDGKLYAVSEDKIICWDIGTKQFIFTYDCEDDVSEFVVRNGRLYAGLENLKVVTIDVNRFEELESIDYGHGVTSLYVSENTLFVGSNAEVLEYRLEDLSVKRSWKIPTYNICADDHFVFFTYLHKIYQYRIDDASREYVYRNPGKTEMFTYLDVDDSNVYTVDSYNTVKVWDKESKELKMGVQLTKECIGLRASEMYIVIMTQKVICVFKKDINQDIDLSAPLVLVMDDEVIYFHDVCVHETYFYYTCRNMVKRIDLRQYE
jgi:outer membrane protein assembly factor BamB